MTLVILAAHVPAASAAIVLFEVNVPPGACVGDLVPFSITYLDDSGNCEIECFLGTEIIRDDVQTGSPEDGPAMVAATVDTHPTDSILVTTRWGDGAVSSQWVQSQAA